MFKNKFVLIKYNMIFKIPFFLFVKQSKNYVKYVHFYTSKPLWRPNIKTLLGPGPVSQSRKFSNCPGSASYSLYSSGISNSINVNGATGICGPLYRRTLRTTCLRLFTDDKAPFPAIVKPSKKYNLGLILVQQPF